MSELYSNIDGGTVSIEDGDKAANKADQYDVSRKVRVELNWTATEGDDADKVKALFDFVALTASNKVAELLGRTAPAAVTAGTTAPAADKPPATRTRRTKEQIAADEAAAKAAQTPAASEEVSFDVEETTLPPASSGGTSAASDDISFDMPADEPAKEITDVDLNAAVQAKNADLKNPGKIKELIATYRTDATKPFNLTQIAQGSRQEFLDKLAALTA